MSHNIEAALEPDHGEHCSICFSGNNTPVIFIEAALFELNTASALLEPTATASGYKNHSWPDYTCRAPPLV